jgi:hypothetical protein
MRRQNRHGGAGGGRQLHQRRIGQWPCTADGELYMHTSQAVAEAADAASNLVLGWWRRCGIADSSDKRC